MNQAFISIALFLSTATFIAGVLALANYVWLTQKIDLVQARKDYQTSVFLLVAVLLLSTCIIFLVAVQ